MNKKVFQLTVILTSLFLAMFIVQPRLAEITADDRLLFAFNWKLPSGNVYQGNTVIFEGTILNNQTEEMQLLQMDVNVYNIVSDDNKTEILYHTYEHNLRNQITRNIVAPQEIKTISFEATLGEELPKAENYTAMLLLTFIHADVSEDDVIPYVFQIGNNATFHLQILRDDAPKYIYGVFVLLLLGIITFVVLGVVGWIRDRRSK